MSVAQPESFFEVLKIWGMGSLYTDISKRVAKCRVCGDPIPKKTRRVVLYTRLSTPTVHRNGGVIMGRRAFFHPECMATKFMTADVVPRHRPGHCADCDQELPPLPSGLPGGLHASLSGHAAWLRICEPCSEKPRWCRCARCGIFYPSYMVKKVLKQSFDFFRNTGVTGDVGADRHCIHCIWDGGLTTQASVVRQRRREERMNDRYERIRNELAERGL